MWSWVLAIICQLVLAPPEPLSRASNLNLPSDLPIPLMIRRFCKKVGIELYSKKTLKRMKGQTCDIIFVISDILGIRPIIKQMSVTYVAEAASLLYLYAIFCN